MVTQLAKVPLSHQWLQGSCVGLAQPFAPSLPSPQQPCLLQEWQCEWPHPQADEDLGL